MSDKASNTSDDLGVAESSSSFSVARSAEGGSGVGRRARRTRPELSEDEDDSLVGQEWLRHLKAKRTHFVPDDKMAANLHRPDMIAELVRAYLSSDNRIKGFLAGWNDLNVQSRALCRIVATRKPMTRLDAYTKICQPLENLRVDHVSLTPALLSLASGRLVRRCFDHAVYEVMGPEVVEQIEEKVYVRGTATYQEH